jgi:hypothetical protein
MILQRKTTIAENGHPFATLVLLGVDISDLNGTVRTQNLSNVLERVCYYYKAKVLHCGLISLEGLVDLNLVITERWRPGNHSFQQSGYRNVSKGFI